MKVEWSANDINTGTYVMVSGYKSFTTVYQIGYKVNFDGNNEYYLVSIADGMVVTLAADGLYYDQDNVLVRICNSKDNLAKYLTLNNYRLLSDLEIFELFKDHFKSKFK